MCKRLLVLSLILMAFGSIQAAELVHRWSFNGDLTDSVGGAHAVIDDVGANDATLSDTEVTLAGGDKGSADYIDLPDGILGSIGSSSITIECWATQISVQNWSRIFDFGSTTTDNIFMSWTVATTLTNDRVEWVPNPGGQMVDGTNAPYDLGVEYHIVLVIEPDSVTWYTAPADSDTLGEPKGSFDASNSITDLGGDNNWIGRSQWPDGTANASFNEFRLWSGALTAAELQTNHEKGPDGIGPKGVAVNPDPAHEAVDVIRDVVASWKPGQYAGTHDVYLGESFADVNDADRSDPLGVQLAQGQDANFVDVGRLEFGKTYYWRVDEVNATPDKTIIPGEIWSFEVEPTSYALTADQVSATASSTTPTGNFDPNALVDGSGLVEGAHSNVSDLSGPATMWLSTPFDFTPTVQFDFDVPQMLDRVLIWNSNQSAEAVIGWGAKDIVMETSLDGVAWTPVEGVTQLSRAPGLPTYDTPDDIPLNHVVAQHVRILIQSSWGGLPVGIGLSEVMFHGVPVYAREPMPLDGASPIDPLSEMTWRQGRQAGQSRVVLDEDPAVAADEATPSVAAQGNAISMAALDVELSQTYYWRVDEVNEAEAVTRWPGEVWSFSTTEYVSVDDFEGYGNISPDRPFQTWIDGIGYSADEHFPTGHPGNGTGAAVGHDIWSLSSPHYQGDIMELGMTVDGSRQSMPVYYTGNSRTDRTFSPSQNWAGAGITTLVLHVKGDLRNDTGSLYIEINGKKIVYGGNALTSSPWTQWNVDLASAGVAVSNVTSLSIGVESTGSGVIYADEIRLYKTPAEPPVSTDPGSTGLAAKYSLDNNLDDTSGNGLGSGTAVGFPIYVDGIVGNGQAMSFNGVDDFVEVPVGGVIGSTASITIGCWADFSNEGGNWQRLWDFGSGEGENPYMFLSPRSGASGPTRCAITTSGNAAESALQSSATLPSGWQHTAVVIDGDAMTMALYINGTPVAQGPTGTVPSDLGDTVQNYLARSQWAADGLYQGSIDELIIYTRALSESEVRYLAGDQ